MVDTSWLNVPKIRNVDQMSIKKIGEALKTSKLCRELKIDKKESLVDLTISSLEE